MQWYSVIKTIEGRRYHYLQKTYREGGRVKTLNKYIGPVGCAGTKIADKSGKPISVFHGTLAEFETFDPGRVGENTGWNNARFGFFFSDAKKSVEEFVEMTRLPGDRRSPRIKEYNLDIRNPLDLTTQGIFTKKEQAPLIIKIMGGENMSPQDALSYLEENIDLGEFPEMMEAIYSNPANKVLIKKHGYDGIISQFGVDENGEVIREYVAFEPSQIKPVPSAGPGAGDGK